jgi:hypothetical protein
MPCHPRRDKGSAPVGAHPGEFSSRPALRLPSDPCQLDRLDCLRTTSRPSGRAGWPLHARMPRRAIPAAAPRHAIPIAAPMASSRQEPRSNALPALDCCPSRPSRCAASRPTAVASTAHIMTHAPPLCGSLAQPGHLCCCPLPIGPAVRCHATRARGKRDLIPGHPLSKPHRLPSFLAGKNLAAPFLVHLVGTVAPSHSSLARRWPKPGARVR